jgi:hypothetical protein
MQVSDLRVRRLTSSDDLSSVRDLGEDTFEHAWQCTPGSFWPSLRQLERTFAVGGAVYIAEHDGRPVGFATAEPTGQMMWLRADSAALGPTCIVCARQIAADFGECWGIMPNDALRAAVVAADPAHARDEGPETQVMRYVP